VPRGRRPALPEDLDADASPPPDAIHCDMCLVGSHRTKILQFGLTRREHVGGRVTTRGAGAIRLCMDCWAHGPKRRMRRHRCPSR